MNQYPKRHSLHYSTHTCHCQTLHYIRCIYLQILSVTSAGH